MDRQRVPQEGPADRHRDHGGLSLAGTAIAVAMVPPVCAFGLLLAKAQWGEALGAVLLFAANLLGILSEALIALMLAQPELRLNFWRSRLGQKGSGP